MVWSIRCLWGFYAFYDGLFGATAVSFAEMPSLEEDLHWKILLAALTTVAPLRMWSRSLLVELGRIKNDWRSIISSVCWVHGCIFLAQHFRADFWSEPKGRCGFFFIFFCLNATKVVFSIPDFRTLIYTFGKCVCLSFFLIYAHFSKTSVPCNLGIQSRSAWIQF